MIQLIQKTIVEKLPNLVGENDASLSFLKYSTPNSGKGPNDKVLFFVFKRGANEPFICAKTVRNYAAKGVVIQNFNNLKKLNSLTASSPQSHLFATALHLHNDGENIFSIETACLGRKQKLNEKLLKDLVGEYISFQVHVAKSNKDFMKGLMADLGQFAKEMVLKSTLKESERPELLRFIATLPLTSIKLPKLIQHGDLTEDNLLWAKDGLCIVDCDFVDLVNLPGFDLYGLFFRYNSQKIRALCNQYLPEYFEKIGADLAGNSYDGLLFLYYFIERMIRKTSPEDLTAQKIISDFEKIVR